MYIYICIYICIHMPAIRGRFLPTMLGNRMPLGDLLKKNMAGFRWWTSSVSRGVWHMNHLVTSAEKSYENIHEITILWSHITMFMGWTSANCFFFFRGPTLLESPLQVWILVGNQRWKEVSCKLLQVDVVFTGCFVPLRTRGSRPAWIRCGLDVDWPYLSHL